MRVLGLQTACRQRIDSHQLGVQMRPPELPCRFIQLFANRFVGGWKIAQTFAKRFEIEHAATGKQWYSAARRYVLHQRKRSGAKRRS